MSNCSLFVEVVEVVEVNYTDKALKVFELVAEVAVVVVYSHNLSSVDLNRLEVVLVLVSVYPLE